MTAMAFITGFLSLLVMAEQLMGLQSKGKSSMDTSFESYM